MFDLTLKLLQLCGATGAKSARGKGKIPMQMNADPFVVMDDTRSKLCICKQIKGHTHVVFTTFFLLKTGSLE